MERCKLAMYHVANCGLAATQTQVIHFQTLFLIGPYSTPAALKLVSSILFFGLGILENITACMVKSPQ